MIFEPEDQQIFSNLIDILGREAMAGHGISKLAAEAGRHFLGARYAANILECRPEQLVINLRVFDCFTFVENAVVLAGLACTERHGFQAYAKALRMSRYKGGWIDGYPSRLHYFTDWIYENARRGILKDLTRALGGKSFRKKIHFMTSNRDRYPGIQDENAYNRMKEAEKRISRRIRYEIPAEMLPTLEDHIGEGNIIAILTDREGLDCLHVGMAIRKGSRLHLIHASEKAGAVIISPQTLTAYLAGGNNRTGILIARMAS
jgi:hypothetical protein